MNDISLIAMDCVAILGIASWFILIGHNQYGKLSKAELTTSLLNVVDFFATNIDVGYSIVSLSKADWQRF